MKHVSSTNNYCDYLSSGLWLLFQVYTVAKWASYFIQTCMPFRPLWTLGRLGRLGVAMLANLLHSKKRGARSTWECHLSKIHPCSIGAARTLHKRLVPCTHQSFKGFHHLNIHHIRMQYTVYCNSLGKARQIKVEPKATYEGQ